MKRTLIRYKAKPERADENESLIRNVFAELHAKALRMLAHYKSGPVYDEVWRRLVQPEKERDPEKKGYAVLIAVERAEDLAGQPLALN
jgi:hypothetical protein